MFDLCELQGRYIWVFIARRRFRGQQRNGVAFGIMDRAGLILLSSFASACATGSTHMTSQETRLKRMNDLRCQTYCHGQLQATNETEPESVCDAHACQIFSMLSYHLYGKFGSKLMTYFGLQSSQFSFHPTYTTRSGLDYKLGGYRSFCLLSNQSEFETLYFSKVLRRKKYFHQPSGFMATVDGELILSALLNRDSERRKSTSTT